MNRYRFRMSRWVPVVGLTGAVLLLGAPAAPAQSMSSGGGGLSSSSGGSGGSSSSGGGFLGGSSGTSGGGSSGGLGSGAGMSSGTTGSGFLTSSTGFLNSGTTISNLNRSSNATYNAFSPYFSNPLATGWPGGTTGATGTFGQPLVSTLTQSSTTTMRGSSGTATFSQTTTGIYSMIGQRRSPAYTTGIGFRFRPPAVSQLQPGLQQVIDRSSTLASGGNNVRVSVDGQTVILRGLVADDHDRRLAESLVRLTPGVSQVRNELSVRPETASTASAR
jgi:BON domain